MAIETPIPSRSNVSCQDVERMSNPVVSHASEALARQRQKAKKILDFKDYPTTEGIYFLPNWSEYDIAGINQRRGIQDLQPRGRSAHDVSFGVADLRTTGKGLESLTVAIKPFEEPARALRDAVSNGIALERGFNTTDPICVIVDKPGSFVVTPAKEGVQTLDTEPWHQFLNNDDIHVHNHFNYRLRQISELLADLNTHGIEFADAALRNFWITPEGEMEPFDWESSTIVSNPPTPNQLTTISINTLRAFYGSSSVNTETVQAILKGPESYKWGQFQSAVFSPYIERLETNFLDAGLIDNEEMLHAITNLENTLYQRLGL